MAEKSISNHWQLQQKREVLLFPFPFHGHINPMLELAAVLHWSCFSITVFHTDYNSDAVDLAKYPSYRFIWIHDRVCKQRSSSHEDRVLSLIHKLNENCREPFREGLRQVLSETEVDGVPWLVLDMHWYMMNEEAQQLGVPTMVLRTGSAASLNGFIALPALYRNGILPAQAERELEETVEELAPLRVRDMISVGKNRDELLKFVELDVENARSSRGVIINTSQAIEAEELEKMQRQLSLPAFAVGPLHKFIAASPNSNKNKKENEEVWRWLESHPPKSVVYVSFGSLACMDGEDLREMAWGLANSGQPFLWVLRPGMVEHGDAYADDYLPEVTRSRSRSRKGMIVPWAAQREVLCHPAVGGFWTHAGWNSTVEAMAEGVPMLCTPFFSDQMGNARYAAEAWGVAHHEILRRPLERGAVERAVRGLLLEKHASNSNSNSQEEEEEDKEICSIRSRARKMQQLLSRSVQRDGSSYRALDQLVKQELEIILKGNSTWD